jgi:hypothetical protein
MSGNTQFDLHPDAESLNAFAEHALAEQERERMMAHLAVCSRCREIVFLAQKELEPELAATAVPHAGKRGPWFRNWRLAWIPVGALAAGITVAYVTHARHEELAKQMAVVERQASPVTVTPQASPLPTESVKGAEKARKQVRPMIPQVPPPAPSVPEELKAAPEAAMARRLPEPQRVAGGMQVPAAGNAVTASAESSTLAQGQVTAAYAPMAQAEAAAAARAARIRSAPNTSMAVYVAGPTVLPSGLAAVSTAMARRNVLAVDKAGSLFFSTDGGAHWENIGRQWSGKAVAVRTRQESKGDAPAADAPAADAAAAKADAAKADAAKADAAKAGAAAGAANGGLVAAGGGSLQARFELVNDQGQVWVSSDGRTWKAK